MFAVTCRWTERFQSCAYELSNPGLITVGPRLVPTTARLGFSAVIALVAELAEIGTAKGGLLLRGDTMFVVGDCVMMAYPPRTEVFPLLNGSQANPIRGWKFRLFCW